MMYILRSAAVTEACPAAAGAAAAPTCPDGQYSFRDRARAHGAGGELVGGTRRAAAGAEGREARA